MPTLRTMFLLVVAMWSASPALGEQLSPPKLTKPQRDTLHALVTAVDNAVSAPETPAVRWQTHLLRTSDGAHYVAFTVTPSEPLSEQDASSLYVRLATRSDAQSAAIAERSAVMEWLKGMRSDPLVARKQRGIAFGEMPVFGPGAIATRGPGQQAGDLALLNMERERARERKEAAERERKAALEGTSTTRPRDALFPFEDFTLDRPRTGQTGAAAMLQRSFTAGPGDYDLYVAWGASPTKGQPGAVKVAKRSLSLPPASSAELGLSSIIVADAVSVRDAAYPPEQQSSHPYAIGAMEIVPSLDGQFTNDERMAVVFQILNARANDGGKPDIGVGFRLFRVTTTGDQSIGLLNPQYYNESTLPLDFDIRKGHPIFAAMAAPLKTLPRGEYRLLVSATDKLSGFGANAYATFHVVATPATLLRTAPIAPPMRREYLLDGTVLREVTAPLRTALMSSALAAAIDAAGAARFIELLREDAIGAAEQSARTTLRAIGLYGIGDPRMAATLLRQVLQSDANAVAQLYFGACRALEGNDRDAIAAWQAALDAGIRTPLVAPLLVDANLRLGDVARAAEIAHSLVRDGLPDAAIIRGLASVHIAQGRELDAIPLLEKRLATNADDMDAQYAMLHALFASFVRGVGVGSTAEAKQRFAALARTYIDGKGRHAGIVSEWVGFMHP